MRTSCSIPCALDYTQLRVVFRDICRAINYTSLDQEVALATPHRLVCEGWKGLPKWVCSAEVCEADGDVKLHIDVESDVAPSNIKVLTDDLTGELSGYLSHPAQPFRTRVFCIGWSKTGTTSLTEALCILGLFSWHFAPWVIGCKHFQSELSQIQADFTGITEYTAVSDLPICALHRELDEAFPGSVFILTARPLETWIASAIAEVENSIKWYDCITSIERWAYGTDTIDIEAFQKRCLQYQE